MKTVKVPLKDESYDIDIESGLLSRCGQIVRGVVANAAKAAIVTDSNVAKLYLETVSESLRASGFEVLHIIVRAGEKSKSLSTLSKVYDMLLKGGVAPSDIIIALGGGVIGDLAGFAAATLLRGVPYIQVPTTLLAQVDSSVGGKVAVNCKAGKNLIGAFYQPLAVIIDPETLKSLPPREIACGLAEVIKYGAICDEALFETLERSLDSDIDYTDIIERCCSIKAGVVSRDTFDKGERMLLNFGHTAGHAIERAAGYGRYTHGEAVAIGMYLEALLGEQLGVTEPKTAERIKNLLAKAGLPHRLNRKIGKAVFDSALLHDKKLRSGSLNMVLLKGVGRAFIYKMDSQAAASMLYNIFAGGSAR